MPEMRTYMIGHANAHKHLWKLATWRLLCKGLTLMIAESFQPYLFLGITCAESPFTQISSPSSGSSHTQWWLILGSKVLTPLPLFRTLWGRFQLLHIPWDQLRALLDPHSSLASLSANPTSSSQSYGSHKNSPNKSPATNLCFRICFLGTWPETTV